MKLFSAFASLITLLITTICPLKLVAQDNEHPREHPAYQTWLRVQTVSQNDAVTPTFPGHGKMSAKELVNFFQYRRTFQTEGAHSLVDQYEMSKTIGSFPEYYALGSPSWSNTIPRSLPFYKDRLHFLKKEKEEYFLNFNPIVVLGGAYESGSSLASKGTLDLAIGAEFRANYNQKIDLDASFMVGSSSLKQYELEYFNTWNSLPGFLPKQVQQRNGRLYYWMPKVNIHFNILKDYMIASIGFDQHQYGSGIRSLLLSEESAPYLYGKLSTKVWKIKYDNLFTKLVTDKIPGLPHYGGKKFLAVHSLSIEVFKWWQLSLFESVTISRQHGFEASYLNPIIFYRAVERSLGSPDKVAVGLHSDFFPINNFKIYGQFLLNEFTAKHFFDRTGYWANKWGAQLGAHYTNVATIENLDLQVETNWVRPYTYTHSYRIEDMNISNFGHGNTPLAHPLGAGFKEILLKAKYRPSNLWTLQYNGLFYQAGQDYDGLNLGNNIFLNYREREKDFGVYMINGHLKEVWLHHLQLSYELWPQLFLDLGGYYRTQSIITQTPILEKEWGVYSRIRLNFWKSPLALF